MHANPLFTFCVRTRRRFAIPTRSFPPIAFSRATLLLACACFFGLPPKAASQTSCPIAWGPIICLSDTIHNAFVPKIAVGGDTLHVVFPAGSVYYNRSTNGGGSWEGPRVIIPSDSAPVQIWSRPFAAHDRNLIFVWRPGSVSQNDVVARRSTDAGTTWLSSQILIPNPTLPGYGNPHVTLQGSRGILITMKPVSGFWQAFVSVSDDSGQSWGMPRQITNGRSLNLEDLGSSANAAYVALLRDEVGFISSLDHGITWSQVRLLSATDGYDKWDPQVACDDSGNAYYCWQDEKYGTINGFTGTLLLRKSGDYGLSWASEKRLSQLPSVNRSAIAVANKSVHIVWADERGAGGSGVYYVGSTDRGISWCPEMKISDWLISGGGDASVGAFDSTVYVVWGADHRIFFRSGKVQNTTSVSETDRLPTAFKVLRAYPNPFNNLTNVEFQIPEAGEIAFDVFDVLGRKCLPTESGSYSAGTHRQSLDGSGLSSGFYYVTVHFKRKREALPIILIK